MAASVSRDLLERRPAEDVGSPPHFKVVSYSAEPLASAGRLRRVRFILLVGHFSAAGNQRPFLYKYNKVLNYIYKMWGQVDMPTMRGG
jgi:hypothetical protein